MSTPIGFEHPGRTHTHTHTHALVAAVALAEQVEVVRRELWELGEPALEERVDVRRRDLVVRRAPGRVLDGAEADAGGRLRPVAPVSAVSARVSAGGNVR